MRVRSHRESAADERVRQKPLHVDTVTLRLGLHKTLGAGMEVDCTAS